MAQEPLACQNRVLFDWRGDGEWGTKRGERRERRRGVRIE